MQTTASRSQCLAALLFAALLSLTTAQATESDVAKERRWAEQVIDGLLDGDETWLTDDDGHEFLAVYTEGDAQSGRAVILVHGIGVHPNWPDVIYPLRAGLLEQEITTLSLQMPVLANDAEAVEYLPLFDEVPGRFRAALDFLAGEGYRDVVLVAHSMGSSMAAYYLAQGESDMVSSAILIGMGPGVDGSMNLESLARIDIPVLDLYGGADLESVMSSSSARAQAGRAIGPGKFSQQRVEAANHFFQGHEDELLERVLEWLNRR